MFAPPARTYEWDSPGVRELQGPHGPLAYAVDRPRAAPRALGLFFHGNACDLTSECVRRPMLALSLELGLEMYSFDYCGYGLSGGGCGPSSDCTAVTASQMLQHVLGQARARKLPLLLLGHSLGAAVAALAAAQLAPEDSRLVAAILMVSAFVTPVGVRWWFLRSLTLYYDNHSALSACADRGYYIVFATGEIDRVVPTCHAEELHNGYRGPKELLIVECNNHTTIMLPEVLLPIVAKVLRERCGRAASLPGNPRPGPAARAAPKRQPAPASAALAHESLLEELANQDLDEEFLALQLRDELALQREDDASDEQ